MNMEDTKNLLANIELLKKRNLGGGKQDKSSYESYITVFENLVPAYNTIVETLVELERVEKDCEGVWKTPARILALQRAGEGRSIEASLVSVPYRGGIDIFFKEGKKEYTWKVADLYYIVMGSANDFSALARELAERGFSSDWIPENLGALFERVLQSVLDEKHRAEKSVEKALEDAGLPAEGDFDEKVALLWEHQREEGEKNRNKRVKELAGWIESFWKKNGEMLTETVDIIWKAREALGYLPVSVVDGLFDEETEEISVSCRDGACRLSLYVSEAVKERVDGNADEGYETTYCPSLLCFSTRDTEGWFYAQLHHAVSSGVADHYEKVKMEEFVAKIKNPGMLLAELPGLGKMLVKKAVKIREVLADVVSKALER